MSTDLEIEQPKQKPGFWFDGVFIDQGWCWGTELVEIEPVDGKRRWNTFPICLGREHDIVPILKGDMDIPECMHPRRRAVLELILGDRNDGRDTLTSGASGLQRGRPIKSLRHRQKDIGRLATRERLSLRRAY